MILSHKDLKVGDKVRITPLDTKYLAFETTISFMAHNGNNPTIQFKDGNYGCFKYRIPPLASELGIETITAEESSIDVETYRQKAVIERVDEKTYKDFSVGEEVLISPFDSKHKPYRVKIKGIGTYNSNPEISFTPEIYDCFEDSRAPLASELGIESGDYRSTFKQAATIQKVNTTPTEMKAMRQTYKGFSVGEEVLITPFDSKFAPYRVKIKSFGTYGLNPEILFTPEIYDCFGEGNAPWANELGIAEKDRGYLYPHVADIEKISAFKEGPTKYNCEKLFTTDSEVMINNPNPNEETDMNNTVYEALITIATGATNAAAVHLSGTNNTGVMEELKKLQQEQLEKANREVAQAISASIKSVEETLASNARTFRSLKLRQEELKEEEQKFLTAIAYGKSTGNWLPLQNAVEGLPYEPDAELRKFHEVPKDWKPSEEG